MKVCFYINVVKNSRVNFFLEAACMYRVILLLTIIIKLIAICPTLAKANQEEFQLGARYSTDGTMVEFAIYSSKASRIEVCLFNEPLGQTERIAYPLIKSSSNVWTVTIPLSEIRSHGVNDTLFYGYRAWGSNWPYLPTWTKGSAVGFKSDVDEVGNRFNPNKLLLDPYAFEVSQDCLNDKQKDSSKFKSGIQFRNIDSGPYAPKGIVLKMKPYSKAGSPLRPLKDDIIYEVNLRGFTKEDTFIPSAFRGTYKGAALKAPYLKELGITAVEFLPIQEIADNDKNDVIEGTDIVETLKQDQYWGYMTLNYFAPDRRYSYNKSPGGPSNEFQEMVQAFHEQGIKVYLDVVYNHTGEGGLRTGTDGFNEANIISWRGIDNTTYYELAADARYYSEDNGVGPNFNCANPIVRNLILDSLKHWKNDFGVDGFRFDLAPFLGNVREHNGLQFDKMPAQNVLNRAVRELPVRPSNGGDGVDLIAEPWGGSYQSGNFPSGWAEWNDRFRDAIRKDQNKLEILDVTPGELALRIAGSEDMFGDDGRKPWHSINYITVHDGFTLSDLYRFNRPKNGQDWPCGPSDGGSDDQNSWNQDNDPLLQRKAARNGIALLLLSFGVPLINGGDEILRSLNGNSNPWNVDSRANWINWQQINSGSSDFREFVKKMIQFRQAHRALRPANFLNGLDHNQNGIKDITWLDGDGNEIPKNSSYWNDPNQHLVIYRIDTSEFGNADNSIFVAYNGWKDPVTIKFPRPQDNKRWYRTCDTASWREPFKNMRIPGNEDIIAESATYTLEGRSVIILTER